ncbi:DUF5677 domain-containing protein [Erysipelothrix rhusiopathiae]|nr:DUF5677 domain-containing protein [Erysipelothrix rhusiopathiae]MDE8230114.1 DUF5677 domain-containing protein [Erysipelothrix rhusiopathiae]MDE8303592.1 DUF5677 domain-containing protein [Erysipelothrix rhusiopathiae]
MEKLKDLKRLEQLSSLYTDLRDYCIEKKVSRPQASIQDISLILLSNDINEISKSVIALYKGNAFLGIPTLVRVAYEKYYYFQHVMKSTTNSKAFYYNLQLKNSLLLKKLTSPNKYSESVAKIQGYTVDEINRNYVEQFGNFDEKIFVELENEYRNCFKYEIKNLYTHKWYSSDKSINNLKDLANSLGLESEYAVQYERLSGEVHSYVMSQNYAYYNVEDKLFLGIYQDGVTTQNNDHLVFMYVKVYKVILDLYKHYKAPKIFYNRLLKIVSETTTLNDLYNIYNK